MRLLRWPSKSNEIKKKHVNVWTGISSASFQIPSQSILYEIPKTHRSSAARITPLFCALREMSSMGVRKIKGLSLVSQAGGRFVKASASSLASVFSKRLQHSRSESNLGFRGGKLLLLHPCISVLFDSVVPTPLTLRANLRLVYLMPTQAFGCG